MSSGCRLPSDVDAVPRNAAVLLSGGVESTVNLAIAINLGWEIEQVFYIDFGQKELERELRCVRDIMEFYHIPEGKLHVGKVDLRPQSIPLYYAGCYEGDVLHIDEDFFEVSNPSYAFEDGNAGYIVPDRNTLFLAYAASLIRQYCSCPTVTILYGANPKVKHPSEDETVDYMRKMEEVLRVFDGDFPSIELMSFGEYKWNGHGDGYTGAINAGLHIGAPFHLTTSCHNGYYYNCGVCAGCISRMQAFMECKTFDPAPYYSESAQKKIAPWLVKIKDTPFVCNKAEFDFNLVDYITNIFK